MATAQQPPEPHPPPSKNKNLNFGTDSSDVQRVPQKSADTKWKHLHFDKPLKYR